MGFAVRLGKNSYGVKGKGLYDSLHDESRMQDWAEPGTSELLAGTD
jgi:hypothetical protein